MIKPCTSPQQPGWLELRQALWPHHQASAHLNEMSRYCAEPQRFGQFIAVAEDDTAQGFAEVALRTDYVNGTASSPVAFLEGIYVAPHARAQGVARALVRAAEQWALARGCSEFASDALVDNVSSHAMHQALGFVETQRVVLFVKSLTTD